MTSNCKRASFHPSVKQLTPFTDKRWTNLSNKTTREVSKSLHSRRLKGCRKEDWHISTQQ